MVFLLRRPLLVLADAYSAISAITAVFGPSGPTMGSGATRRPNPFSETAGEGTRTLNNQLGRLEL
jgi:hypothetical protein